MDYGLDYAGDASPSASRGGASRVGGSNTQTQSEVGGRKRASQDEQTIRAVTVSMMMESQTQQLMESTGLQLPDGRNLYHVQFIAAVRSFDDHSTHVMYQMEDGSGGVIGVKQWLDDTAECTGVTELRRLCSREHVYLKVIGQLKDYDGQKMVLADSIRPLVTANQLTHHFLQVVYQAEMYKKEEQLGSMGRGIQAGFAGTPIMSRGAALAQHGGGGGKDSSLHQAIMNAFSEGEMGNTITNVVQSLKGKYPVDTIKNAISYLSNEGKLYSTIDEEHFSVA